MLAKLTAKLAETAIIGGARLLTGAQAQWRGCRPENRQRIFVANHTSHLDFILLWACLPRALRSRTRPVAAADYWQRGVVRRYLATRVFKAVLVKRGGALRDQSVTDPMLAALEGGDSLILFPEGTRGDGDDLLPFKPGIFHIAKARPGAQLVPVWMDNSHRVMPKGSLLLAPMLCSATFGKPVEIEPDETKEIFLQRLRQSVKDSGAM
jgi:1-acyl-sn-glycerol-3-phosphate acyltransferase